MHRDLRALLKVIVRLKKQMPAAHSESRQRSRMFIQFQIGKLMHAIHSGKRELKLSTQRRQPASIHRE